MNGINKVILIGSLGKDPEVRTLPGGNTVASFSMATSERWKEKDGTPKERTDWHQVTAWGRLGEICGQYLHKGAKVYIEGKLQTDKYTNKDGATVYSTKVVAKEMQILSGKPDTSQRKEEPEMPSDDWVDEEITF
jgi:single-strand DNA-binding protein